GPVNYHPHRRGFVSMVPLGVPSVSTRTFRLERERASSLLGWTPELRRSSEKKSEKMKARSPSSEVLLVSSATSPYFFGASALPPAFSAAAAFLAASSSAFILASISFC